MDLNDYRKEIDRIDDQLIALFAKRMETAEKIAAYKKANGLRVLDRFGLDDEGHVVRSLPNLRASTAVFCLERG